uniref:Smr domain-containing protein n=1 Tax=Nicotiana tabacum TaxID=4097 RepID=A0A1S3Y0Q9_TOBAC|nr:PREDICTED: uncharacterized protein LOC107770840 [Nicotiana tabacum]
MNQVNLKPSFGAAVSVETSDCIDVDNESKGSLMNKQRPAFLEVITGKGTHSRGHAALPLAIRSFLIENGYYSLPFRHTGKKTSKHFSILLTLLRDLESRNWSETQILLWWFA